MRQTASYIVVLIDHSTATDLYSYTKLLEGLALETIWSKMILTLSNLYVPFNFSDPIN